MDAVTPATALVEKKRRTITLTNRAPITIIEDNWPIIAQGICGEDAPEGSPYEDWEIAIRVREHRQGSKIVHASYKFNDEIREEWHSVRVGRLLGMGCSDEDVWQAIIEVGNELRERINPEGMRKYVTVAVDACFAKMPPHHIVI